MNSTVKRIVEVLFQDTAENEETAALKEEVMNNCQEHFDDLIAGGMGEDEAIGVIVESLKGMKEVIDEYPRKDEPLVTAEEIRQRRGAAAEPLRDPDTAEGEDDGNRVFTGVGRIRTEMKDMDLLVTESEDDLVHILTQDPERIVTEMQAGRLVVKARDRMTHAADAWKNEAKPEDTSLQGILKFVGRVIRNVTVDVAIGGQAEIRVPRGTVLEMDLNTASGNIDYRAELPETLSLRSASGDLDVNPAGGKAADRISAATASGDVTLRGAAKEADISSLSGDCSAEGAFETLKVRSTSGDAEFTGSAVSLVIHSVSGDADVRLENADAERIEAKSTSGDVEIVLPAEIAGVHAEISSLSGERRNSIPDAGAGAQMQIRAATVSGDVNIRQ